MNELEVRTLIDQLRIKLYMTSGKKRLFRYRRLEEKKTIQHIILHRILHNAKYGAGTLPKNIFEFIQ